MNATIEIVARLLDLRRSASALAFGEGPARHRKRTVERESAH